MGGLTASDVEYVLGRLDMGHVRSLGENARDLWLGGVMSFELCYQPGDGTHYGLLLVPLDARLPVLGAAGGGTGGHGPTHAWGGKLKEEPDRLLVYWIQRSEGIDVANREFVHPARVTFDTTPASELALAVLLNHVTGYGDEWIDAYVENIRINERDDRIDPSDFEEGTR